MALGSKEQLLQTVGTAAQCLGHHVQITWIFLASTLSIPQPHLLTAPLPQRTARLARHIAQPAQRTVLLLQRTVLLLQHILLLLQRTALHHLLILLRRLLILLLRQLILQLAPRTLQIMRILHSLDIVHITLLIALRIKVASLIFL